MGFKTMTEIWPGIKISCGIMNRNKCFWGSKYHHATHSTVIFWVNLTCSFDVFYVFITCIYKRKYISLSYLYFINNRLYWIREYHMISSHVFKHLRFHLEIKCCFPLKKNHQFVQSFIKLPCLRKDYFFLTWQHNYCASTSEGIGILDSSSTQQYMFTSWKGNVYWAK